MLKKLICLTLASLVLIQFSIGQKKLQTLLDSLRTAGNYPGLSVSIIKTNGDQIDLVSGFNDKEKRSSLKKSDMMLQGSVGKTYASALALMLVQQGKIDLDKPVLYYLGIHDWYLKIPNAKDVTVRMLMNHTSGIMRYEFKEKFTQDLTSNPDKVWSPVDLLTYIFNDTASFKAGEGWEYSDTNYILLGMIIEQVTGKKYYDLLSSMILQPQKLRNTLPSDQRRLKGLAQGYAGAENAFGGKDKVVDEKGFFIINPQFEWTGGGIYSTTNDLTKWGKLLYESKIVDTALLFSSAAPAKLGKDTRYALGVIIRPTALGNAYGHSGFFPGYLTELFYFPEKQICISVQANSSDFKSIKMSPFRILLEMAKASAIE
jgi:D-alanyl-D-alanine carboxypeptidase